MKELKETGKSETQERENEKVKPNDVEWHQFQKDRREKREKQNKKKIKQTKLKMKNSGQ